ncbi:hypothetical protein ACFYYH_06610 [Streptomyces sp. NPDC002018]|uniref:hypothetical protein n=1 Tax=Streptomyces sp. NPDC002018 TaxID=3364629 RepID=UPI0036748722
MTGMRRGLVHAMAWSLATGAAVTLSWWGVRTVMAGTAYDPPRAIALPGDNAAVPRPSPVTSSTRRPPAPSTSPSRPAGSAGTDTGTEGGAGAGAHPGAGGKTPDAAHPPSPRPYPSAGGPAQGAQGTQGTQGSAGDAEPAASGQVKSYTVDGGRVAFDIGEVSAELVSATPDPGWQMQVWTQPAWIRVTFTQNGREVSVFCTWNDHPPMVQFDDR